MAEPTTLQGVGVSPGLGIGVIARMGQPITELPEVKAETDPEEERDRAFRALEVVAETLDGLRDRAAGAAQAVLEAQSMIARDPALRMSIEQACKSGRPAPHAVHEAVGGFKEMLLAAGGYMAERAADLDDIRNRAVARLLHLPMPGLPKRDTPFVLVADDLAPADTVDINPDIVVALVTEHGGPTSHTAIIAKAMGLPAIVSCHGVLAVDDDTPVIVDGATGTVVLAPSPDAIKTAKERDAAERAALGAYSGPGRTADGHAVKLLVNIGQRDQAAAEADAEGVGLLRTELIFLDAETEPTVAEQAAIYSRVFSDFKGRKVVVRTLDIGADKPLPFVADGPGENPALGLRGWRLRELEPGVIERQLEAIASAAAQADCEVWTMAPMIATVEEAREFVEIAHAAGLPIAGVMVEIPSLALQADALMEVVDFVSLGTNDLSQYTFAADRQVGELGALLDPWQPALLQLIARTAAAGRKAATPVGICGEAASDAGLAPALVGMGVTSLSMAAGAVPAVRAALAGVTLEVCERAAEAALTATDPASARSAVAEAIKG